MGIEQLICCGMRELDGLPDKPVFAVLEVAQDHPTPISSAGRIGGGYVFVVFSDVVGSTSSNGEKLAKFVRANKLGLVKSTSERMNPNTGNTIKAWIWELDHEALFAFRKAYEKNHPHSDRREELGTCKCIDCMEWDY